MNLGVFKRSVVFKWIKQQLPLLKNLTAVPLNEPDSMIANATLLWFYL